MGGETNRSRHEEAVQLLLSSLRKGDTAQIQLALEMLGVTEQSDVHRETGMLARKLHSCIAEFQRSLSTDSPNMSCTTIREAGPRLERVLNLTFEAANTVLDVSEEQEQLYQQQRKALENLKSEIEKDENLSEEVAVAFRNYYTQEHARLTAAFDNNQKVFISQNFQDLSGQTLKKVIKLVNDIESTLDQLLCLFDPNKETVLTELKEEPKPISAQSVSEESLDQNDADKMLKELGF